MEIYGGRTSIMLHNGVWYSYPQCLSWKSSEHGILSSVDTDIMEPQVPRSANKKIIFIAVSVIVVVIGVFLAFKYSQYLDYFKTEKEIEPSSATTTLSTESQQELAELDRLRAEHQATFNPPTTTVESQLKSLDVLRAKTKLKTSPSTTTIGQQLSELDALRAQTQTQAQP